MSGPEEFEVEYGSISPARFIYVDPVTGERQPVVFPTFEVKAYDKEGNEIDMNCKCGKPGNMIMGKEAFIVRCNKCGWT